MVEWFTNVAIILLVPTIFRQHKVTSPTGVQLTRELSLHFKEDLSIWSFGIETLVNTDQLRAQTEEWGRLGVIYGSMDSYL